MIKRILLIFFLILVVGLALGASALAVVYSWAVQDLPSYTRIADYRPPLVSTVYARDNSVMGYFYREKRFLSSLSDMPPYLPLAFLAAEDDGFYEHQGVSPVAILRAFLVNLKSGTNTQGGSTITQQIVKRLLLSAEKSYERKIKEAILAYRLENYLTKDEILTIYLNQIYLGSGAYGVEAAARAYFGKHVNDLTLAEAAVLASLPKAPTTSNPYRNPEETKRRQRYVLRRLHELHWISEEDYEKALAQPLVYKSMDEPTWKTAAWYVEEVRRQLIDYLSEDNMRAQGILLDRYGEDALYEGGLHIYTSMEPAHQAAAEDALHRGLEEADKRYGWRGPLETLEDAQAVAAFLEKNKPDADFLKGNSWARAVVTQADQNGLDVRVGDLAGRIDLKNMAWARTPNIKVAGAYAPPIKDARKVAQPGDVVWVSVVPGTYNLLAPESERDKTLTLALQQYPAIQGAIVSIEPETGDVVAMVGGYSFQNSQFNRATQAKRQPGSSFKPFVYSAALDAGYTPASIVLDAPIVYINESTSKLWRPENYEGKFSGPMMLRTALAKSRNMCTIRVAQDIGIQSVINRALAMGIHEPFPPELAVSLGAVAVSPINFAEAYTAFANQGKRAENRMIRSVTDAAGEPLATFEPRISQVITPENAYVMANLLEAVVNEGTGTRAKIPGRHIAGKTGTTNDEKDAWFMGFSPYLVTGVYVGYDQLQPMGRLEGGGRTAAPIFSYYRKEIEDTYENRDFVKPDDIVMETVHSGGRSIAVPFMPGTGPDTYAPQDVQPESTDGADLFRAL